MPDFIRIQSSAPKAWEDFKKFYSDNFGNLEPLKKIDFTTLPFEMQLGIFLKYFRENGVEPDVQNLDISELENTIADLFEDYERMTGHFS
jgi:hypothetical protein